MKSTVCCRLLLLLVALGRAVAQGAVMHCANSDGNIVGLASDQAYHLRLPADAPGNPEQWVLVQDDDGGKNSFAGSYVQVLPDDRDSYNAIYGAGSFTMTGLDFSFTVAAAGTHTLFLRWTGGDTVGGGDSLYVLVRDGETDEVLPGRPTIKPALVDIADAAGIAGCCYNMATHECVCKATEEPGHTADCSAWVAADRAIHFGAQCPAAEGAMESVPEPLWYLYSGQANGNVMDFSSEPWDSTCEAAGQGTRDTGLDFAAWDLAVGTYRLVFYPREDGTAIDAWHLSGPDGKPPDPSVQLQAGASTTECGSTPRAAPPPREGPKHHAGDAAGWGHNAHHDHHEAAGKVGPAGGSCGLCLEPLADDSVECPTADVLETMITCDNVSLGELCEADGECGTTEQLNNCGRSFIPPTPGKHPTDTDGPRGRYNRNNDVYRRVPCAAPAAPSGGGWSIVAWILVLSSLAVGAKYVAVPAVRAHLEKNGGMLLPPGGLFRPKTSPTITTIDTSGIGALSATPYSASGGVGNFMPPVPIAQASSC